MSKELEALKSIKGTIIFSRVISGVEGAEHYYIGNLKSIKKHFDIIEEALKRNEPMKVISFDSSSYYGGLGYLKCPNCGEILISGEMLIKGYYNYCPDCGQKLDWSDEK